MSFELPPATVAQLDQDVALVGEVLTTIVDAHRVDVSNFGDSASIISIAAAFAEAMQDNPWYVVNLLTIAVNRLARV